MNDRVKVLAAFKSFQKQPTEAEIVTIARQLLDEHAASREAATKALNLTCGACQGTGQAHSEIAGGVTTCWACGGDGKPNDKIQSLPALEQADHERLYKLTRLIAGPHGKAVLQVIREYMPDLFKSEGSMH